MMRARGMGHVAESINTLLYIYTILYYFKVPAESPRCFVEESMGERGSACSVGLQQEAGRIFVLPQRHFGCSRPSNAACLHFWSA